MSVRVLTLSLFAAMAATGAAAQGRPSTTAMSCQEATRFVASQGGIVLGTGGQTYDRFVSSQRFCQATEQVKPAFVPTRDTSACPIGYTCFEPGGERDGVGR